MSQLIKTFLFTHDVQNITLTTGTYFMECYGAQGGCGFKDGDYQTWGGRGAFTSGQITIEENTTFFIYVGGMGIHAKGENKEYGGWNGGGKGAQDTGWDLSSDNSGGGGGASDIRTSKKVKDRIMVAAGGSGSSYLCDGAPGGDLNGYVRTGGNNKGYEHTSSVGQEKGLYVNDENSEFVYGEDGKDDDCIPSSGAGGGYRGGTSPEGLCPDEESYLTVAASGSSYISGYPGCSNHSSGLVFTETRMLPGIQEEDGFVKIYEVKELVREKEVINYVNNCDRMKLNLLTKIGFIAVVIG